jgi:pantothenate synthetase (EC 6.3.2.1)
MGDEAVPDTHPRYHSLVTRARIEAGVEAGITARGGLIAQGRGEAFDYLLGEQTIPTAAEAAEVAAALLLEAAHPVISVNGNVAALVPDATVAVATATEAALEINLFHASEQRREAIAAHLRAHGADAVGGFARDATIEGIDHARATVDAAGIAAADVVLVPLEDGDRAAALAAAGKREIVIDLNPLSRSMEAATVPVADNVMRAMPAIAAAAERLRTVDAAERRALIARFDADAARTAAERAIRRGALS